MKKWFLNFAAVTLAGILAGTAPGELVRVQVEKGDGIEAGYAAKVVELVGTPMGFNWIFEKERRGLSGRPGWNRPARRSGPTGHAACPFATPP